MNSQFSSGYVQLHIDMIRQQKDFHLRYMTHSIERWNAYFEEFMRKFMEISQFIINTTCDESNQLLSVLFDTLAGQQPQWANSLSYNTMDQMSYVNLCKLYELCEDTRNEMQKGLLHLMTICCHMDTILLCEKIYHMCKRDDIIHDANESDCRFVANHVIQARHRLLHHSIRKH